MKELLLILLLTVFTVRSGKAQPPPSRLGFQNAGKSYQSADRFFTVLLGNPGDSLQARVQDSVQRHPNQFAPPVLFALSGLLSRKGHKKQAAFWYELARLRTRIAIRLTRREMHPYGRKILHLYEQEFGRGLQTFGRQHPREMKVVMTRVIRYVDRHKPGYSPYWLLPDGRRTYSSEVLKKMMSPKKEWSRIKTETLAHCRKHIHDFIDQTGF